MRHQRARAIRKFLPASSWCSLRDTPPAPRPRSPRARSCFHRSSRPETSPATGGSTRATWTSWSAIGKAPASPGWPTVAAADLNGDQALTVADLALMSQEIIYDDGTFKLVEADHCRCRPR